jgi:hypothetical protein
VIRWGNDDSGECSSKNLRGTVPLIRVEKIKLVLIAILDQRRNVECPNVKRLNVKLSEKPQMSNDRMLNFLNVK